MNAIFMRVFIAANVRYVMWVLIGQMFKIL